MVRTICLLLEYILFVPYSNLNVRRTVGQLYVLKAILKNKMKSETTNVLPLSL